MNVYRVAEVAIREVAKTSPAGVAVGDTIKVRIAGGTVGCRMFRISGEPDIEAGMDLALFLTRKPEPNLAAAAFDGLDVINAWPIVRGQAQSPSGAIAVDELLSLAAMSE